MVRVLAVAGVLALAVVPAKADEDVLRARMTAAPREAQVEVTIASGWHVNAHEPRDPFLIPTTLAVTPPAGVTAGEVAWPHGVERRLAFGGDKPLLLYEGKLPLAVPLSGAPTDLRTVRASLRYQACDDTRCLPPRTLDLTAEMQAAAGAGTTGAAPDARVEGWVARWGWPATFLVVALLGVALNLTPCVYPLISVTVAFFGGQTAGGERHTVRR